MHVHYQLLSICVYKEGIMCELINSLLFAEQVQKQKRSPYVGIATFTLTPHLAAMLRNRGDIKDLDIERGVFVVEVNPGSPAQQ